MSESECNVDGFRRIQELVKRGDVYLAKTGPDEVVSIHVKPAAETALTAMGVAIIKFSTGGDAMVSSGDLREAVGGVEAGMAALAGAEVVIKPEPMKIGERTRDALSDGFCGKRSRG